MYEELIRVLRHCGNPNVSCKGCSDEDDCIGADGAWEIGAMANMRAAAEAIEELIATVGTAYNELANNEANKPRWIPVTERLPEEKQDGFSDDVLMLVENPDGDITWKDVYVGYYLYDATSAETGWWAMMTCDCVKIGEHKYGSKVFPANEYVTHWMPLPEPPKEEA